MSIAGYGAQHPPCLRIRWQPPGFSGEIGEFDRALPAIHRKFHIRGADLENVHHRHPPLIIGQLDPRADNGTVKPRMQPRSRPITEHDPFFFDGALSTQRPAAGHKKGDPGSRIAFSSKMTGRYL